MMPFDFKMLSNLMMDELEKNEKFLPSAFWRDINARNVAMLEADGLDRFKRNVSQNYYNWLITNWLSSHFLAAAADWILHPRLLPFFTKIEDTLSFRLITQHEPVTLSPLQRNIYRLFVSFLWLKMQRLDTLKLHERVTEPLVGDPIHIHSHSGHLLSQDLANSIVECNTLVPHLPQVTHRRLRIAEIGAGYGRLAHVYAQTQPGTYFIFDIPPALCVSQWYLNSIFPHKKIFNFQAFTDFNAVQQEVENADIVIMTANQIELLPDGYFDAIVSISTLPEMSLPQAQMYLDLFQRSCSGAIFLKQWKRWKNQLDGTALRPDDYKLNSNWSLVLDQTDPINPRFFNRIWTCAA